MFQTLCVIFRVSFVVSFVVCFFGCIIDSYQRIDIITHQRDIFEDLTAFFCFGCLLSIYAQHERRVCIDYGAITESTFEIVGAVLLCNGIFFAQCLTYLDIQLSVAHKVSKPFAQLIFLSELVDIHVAFCHIFGGAVGEYPLSIITESEICAYLILIAVELISAESLAEKLICGIVTFQYSVFYQFSGGELFAVILALQRTVIACPLVVQRYLGIEVDILYQQ